MLSIFNKNKTYITKKGFTLAEVLITLTIIGVVAAMIIPTVINNAQDKQFKAMFKKEYSSLAQTLQMMYAKDGESLALLNSINSNNFWQMSSFVCRMGKELKYVKSGLICTSDNLNMGSNMSKNEDVSWHKTGEWFNKKKEPMSLNIGYVNYTFLMLDGALINFNSLKTVFIDVNGYKKPNTVGRDIFYFRLKQDNLAPIFFDGDSVNVNGCSAPYNTLITKENYKEDCETGSGWGCSPLYIIE